MNEQFSGIRIAAPPPPRWNCYPCGRAARFMIAMPAAPNRFHRLMQRLFLGFVYERTDG